MKSNKYLIGIDEAGRGPLAGPLVFSLVAVREGDYDNFLKEISSFNIPLRDSKKLSLKMRLKWRKFLYQQRKEKKIIFSYKSIRAQRIDNLGLIKSSKFCINCLLSCSDFSPLESKILLDGGLKAPVEYIFQETIIKGDEKEPLISLASIIAKTTRDIKLCHLAKKFPEYGFEKHKGYGTKEHRQRIEYYGLCPEHRRSFVRK
ncbi:MAG TPA: ribonuclease HII [Candidatus Vogelbacteria bacterium]|nr:ribonuclease HII [Candidatus Vogelbacteria bacterium]